MVFPPGTHRGDESEPLAGLAYTGCFHSSLDLRVQARLTLLNINQVISVFQPPGACPGSPFPRREAPHKAPQTRSGSFHQCGGFQIAPGAGLPTTPCTNLACRASAPAARGAFPKCLSRIPEAQTGCRIQDNS